MVRVLCPTPNFPRTSSIANHADKCAQANGLDGSCGQALNLLLNPRGLWLVGALLEMRHGLLEGSFIYLQQVEETGDLYPQFCLLKEKLNHCLYILFG